MIKKTKQNIFGIEIGVVHTALVELNGVIASGSAASADLVLWVAMGLTAYAALIASFLGGIHWGVAWLRMERGQQGARTHLAWGVMPSLLAWPGVVMPAYAGLVWLALVLVLCYLVDRKLYASAGLSSWLALRFRLSAVAALSCLVGAGAV